MDFLPIMPLNENDHDANEKIDIPSEIALLPLRNTVLFPGVVLPITVGRDKSIKAVNKPMIFVFIVIVLIVNVTFLIAM